MTLRLARAATLAGVLLALLAPDAKLRAAGSARPSSIQPLLDYVASVPVTGLPYEDAARNNLRALRRELAVAAPPASDCNRALGARRYAALYRDMAMASESLGDFAGASRLMRQALDCAPRDPSLLGAYASDLLILRRFDEARSTLGRALDIEPKAFDLRSILLRLEFHEQRWPVVIGLAQQLQAEDEDDSHWVYWQLLAQVAALRAGTPPPALPKRKLGDEWPVPLWMAIGGRAEAPSLQRDFEQAEDEGKRRQRICEAMFYLGEVSLARGDNALARQQFALATRMKILDYIEHDLALGELARLRASAAPAPISGANLPAAAHDVLVAR